VEDTFRVVVNPVNDNPTISAAIPDVTVNEDAANTIINLHPFFADVEDADSALTYSVSCTNPSLFASLNIIDPTNFTLDYALNANGISDVTIRATDSGGLWVEDTFRVVVNPVNDNPTTQVAIPDLTVNEDAANTVINLYPFFADVEDADSALTYSVSYTNPGLFASVNITDPTNFTLDYAVNANGTSDVTIRATDSEGLWVEDTFRVTVYAVNDAPVNANVPLSAETTMSYPLVFHTTCILDSDAGSSPVQVTLIVTNGTLTLSGTSGLTFSVGDGTADAYMIFRGSLSSVNAALDEMFFTPASIGTGIFQMTTNDLGNTGAGGALSDTDTFNIFVL
jgi:hypothetical protein